MWYRFWHVLFSIYHMFTPDIRWDKFYMYYGDVVKMTYNAILTLSTFASKRNNMWLIITCDFYPTHWMFCIPSPRLGDRKTHNSLDKDKSSILKKKSIYTNFCKYWNKTWSTLNKHILSDLSTLHIYCLHILYYYQLFFCLD